MKKILLSLLCAISILFIGCGKKFEGKYTHFDLRKEKAAIYFMNDKIRYTIDGKEVGIFDYTYNKKEKTVIIHMDGDDLIFVYNKKEKTFSCDIFNDSITRVFVRDN